MANMQPTRSVKFNTGSTTPSVIFDALHAQFVASTHWSVVYFTSGAGFVVKQSGGLDTLSQYLFTLSGANISCRMDPNGTMTDSSGAGASVMATEATTASGISGYTTWHFHEWADAFTLFHCNYANAILAIPFAVHAGYTINPFFSTDYGVGLTGQAMFAGVPSFGNSGTYWGSTSSNRSFIRVAKNGDSGDWVKIGGTTNGSINSNLISDRDQPVACVVSTHPIGREIGTFKYIYLRYPSANPGVSLYSGGIRRMYHFGVAYSSNYQHVMGCENDFQPAGSP